MEFLKKLDHIYAEALKTYGIQNNLSSFSCFIPISPIQCKTTCQFLLKKQDKTKLLLISGKQRIYISDIQIINIILAMDFSMVEWFLQQFISLYCEENKQIIRFSINDETFEGHGIRCYPQQKRITLFSDTTIDINDLVFVINFIFCKDQCWETISGIKNFSKDTLCKYLVMIDYYAKKTSASEVFLKANGYPIDSEYPVHWKSFKTEMFDISLYT